MSYCRFSNDDYQCDVYAYEDVNGGYTLHVARSRTVFKDPLPPKVSYDADNATAWVARHQKVSQMFDEADRVDIDLPHCGAYYNFGTPDELADFLCELRDLGYVVPEYAIEALREEATEVK